MIFRKGVEEQAILGLLHSLFRYLKINCTSSVKMTDTTDMLSK